MQKQLFDSLMLLCKNSEVFYYQDEIGLNHSESTHEMYRVFTYRLASAKDFNTPESLESRGIMFRIDENGEYLELVCRTQPKFFNLNESPDSTVGNNVSTSEIKYAMHKLDGSIINSYKDINNELQLKSHTKLDSVMAIESKKLLCADIEYFEAVKEVQDAGYTVNFEYTSPMNQIVVFYNEPKLTVLNVRNISTGEILYCTELHKKFPKLKKYCVQIDDICKEFPMTDTIINSAKEILNISDLEGFIIVTSSGTYKVKSNWYCTRHRALDSVLTDKGLFFMITDNAIDDVKPYFKDSSFVLEKIAKMENLVQQCYNDLKNTVEAFYEENKHLSQKEFAITLNKTNISEQAKGLIFLKKANREVNYMESIKKYYRELIY